MAVKPGTAAGVEKLVTKVDKAKEAVDADFDELKKKLPEAIKAKQRSTIELHLKTLETVINRSVFLEFIAAMDAALVKQKVVA
jgi:broad-specificity NMP kinase